MRYSGLTMKQYLIDLPLTKLAARMLGRKAAEEIHASKLSADVQAIHQELTAIQKTIDQIKDTISQYNV